jgi:invasion protein IalB
MVAFLADDISEWAGSRSRIFLKTRLPAGCVIPVAFDKAKLDVLSKGKVLTIRVAASDNGQPASFGVSLKGFSSELARTVALSGEQAR